MLLSLHVFNLLAQSSFSISVKNARDRSPLAATVFIKPANRSMVADSFGLLKVTDLSAGSYTFLISHIGFQSRELAVVLPLTAPGPVLVEMSPIEAIIEDVVVQSTRTNRNLADIPTRIEAIAADELDEKSTMKPGDIRMLLNESTGINTQQTSAVSGTANIRIQGLDGRYTQLLKDGMPLYSGFSGGLSIMQIPPLDLKQVEYIKGSSSTLYGGGAISGLINLITKTPGEKREANFLINANSAKGFDASGFYSRRSGSAGITVFGSYDHNGPYDPGGTGITANPKLDRFVLNPKLFLYFNSRTNAWIGLNTTFEDRLGGDLEVVRGNAGGLHQYFEHNLTKRISGQFSLTHTINGVSSIHLKSSVGVFDRELSLASSAFSGSQVSSFSELNYVYRQKKNEWVVGLNEWTEKFTPRTATQLTYRLSTLGFFLQNTFRLSHLVTVESGLRIDNNNPATNEKSAGLFVLPRLNLLFKISDVLSSRIGGGLGYKMPTPFIEDAEKIAFQNLHPIDFSTIRAERSYGINADISYRKRIDETTISFNQFFFYTKLNHPVLLQGQDYVNASGTIDVAGVETNLRLSFDELALNLGYTYVDAREHFNGLNKRSPLTAKHRINADLTYEVEGSLRAGLEAFYTGEQLLSDGTTGRSFVTFGLLVQKMYRHFDVFVNGENITDRRQTRWDAIYTGSISNPVFRDIYAPLDGMVINAGVKIKL